MIRRIVRRQGSRRSPRWRSVRKQHLLLEPTCRACGSDKKLQVHHIRPFHVHPELELAQENLITLCERPSRDCHFRWGHFFDWSWWNESVREDAAEFLAKYKDAERRFDV